MRWTVPSTASIHPAFHQEKNGKNQMKGKKAVQDKQFHGLIDPCKELKNHRQDHPSDKMRTESLDASIFSREVQP